VGGKGAVNGLRWSEAADPALVTQTPWTSSMPPGSFGAYPGSWTRAMPRWDAKPGERVRGHLSHMSSSKDTCIDQIPII
jgi:hypothetical protein